MPENEARSIAVEFTRKQYLALLKAVYLGNRVANGSRDGGPLDPFLDEYEDTLHRVFLHARRFGLEKYSHGEDDEVVYHPTRLFEEGTDVRKILDAYEDSIFWDELAERLGERDFHARHHDEDAGNMPEQEYMKRHDEYTERYENEFAEHGIDRLEIKENGNEGKKS